MTGTEFRALMMSVDLNQKEVADALGVSVRTLRRWERTEEPIPRAGMIRLAFATLRRRANR